MADSDGDADLQRAVFLSLEESKPKSQNNSRSFSAKNAVINLVSDDEEEEEDDDDLDAPMVKNPLIMDTKAIQYPQDKSMAATSNQSEVQSTKVCNVLCFSEKNSWIKQDPAPTSLLGGLDRKKMEEERLARVATTKKKIKVGPSGFVTIKRKAPVSPSRQSISKKQMVDQLSEFPVSLSGRAPTVQESKPTERKVFEDVYTSKLSKVECIPIEVDSTKPFTSHKGQQQTGATSGVQYPDGVIKKTWVYGCPRSSDDIKIEEVFQKGALELAVLSAYQVDSQWVMSKLDPKTKVVMVLQAKTEQEKQRMRDESNKNFRFCFPSMEGQINCMHSKLQLLAYPTHLRIAVPSANLVPYDWGETGVMENICFLIDLPRTPLGNTTELTPFGAELLYFLGASGLDKSLINSMQNFDFSRTSRLAFIHTIGGSHGGDSWIRTGYCGLGTAVSRLGLDTEHALNIDFVTASLGDITENFMKRMVLAAKGDDGSTEFDWRTDKRKSKNRTREASATEQKLSDEVQNRCRIYFPLNETVARSRGGVGAGGTICAQSRWYDSPSFPRSLMRDNMSIRDGILMHDKIIYVRHKNPAGKAWAYVGSANLSESAWGRLVKDRTSNKPKLNARNWETGVLFPVERSQIPASSSADRGELGMDIFKGQIPIPMIIPGQLYETRRPWFYSEV